MYYANQKWKNLSKLHYVYLYFIHQKILQEDIERFQSSSMAGARASLNEKNKEEKKNRQTAITANDFSYNNNINNNNNEREA